MLTLTCAVLDTERVKVVVDESGLAPSALHLVPFDIVGGERFRDILNAPRRFFQYQYSMRVLGEEFFGKEITLPRLQISYRVQNSLQGGAALQGREAQYSLVPVPIRVLSLVPAGTSDIRDTPVDTFGDVDARLFRSNLLLILAGVAFVLAGLMAVMLVARAAVKRHATSATRQRRVSPGAVLRAASRELGAVQSASQSGGWSGDLAGRAAAALRLAGAVALSRPVSHKEVDRDTPPSEGQIAAAPGLGSLRGRRTVLSASVTPDTTALNGKSASASESWRSLSQPLGVFTAVRYSRDGERRRHGARCGTCRRTGRRQAAASHAVAAIRAIAGATPKPRPHDRHGHAERAHRAGRADAQRVALVRHRRSRVQRAQRGAAGGGAAGGHRRDRARVAIAPRQAAWAYRDRAARGASARFSGTRRCRSCGTRRSCCFWPAFRSSASRLPIRTRRCRRGRCRIPGRRIAVIMDASLSMLSPFSGQQLKTQSDTAFSNTMAAAEYFIRVRMKGHYRDLIALEQFGNEAYVITPFTTDYENLLLSLKMISDVNEWQRFPDQGTIIMKAIDEGVDLFNAFDFLDSSGNIMVIFSDGQDNNVQIGTMSLDQVLKKAVDNKVPVYMIRTAYARGLFDVVPDQVWKKAIDATGGKFFPAASQETIMQAIKEIDAAATGRVDVREYEVKQPRYMKFALAAVVLWTLALALQMTLRMFRTFP